MTVDIDAFYSAEPIDAWREILGDGLHYHGGYFHGHEDLVTGQRQAVQRLWQHIPSGASVLDAGCGWGGPATMLVHEHGCRVEGVTVSTAQAAYCRSIGIEASRLDLETDELRGRYDVAFALESLSHMADKREVLRTRRGVTRRRARSRRAGRRR